MQTKKKDETLVSGDASADRPPALSDASATDDGYAAIPRFSPARALQIRLARELSAPPRTSLWHSAGLVLALLLSLSLAGAMLDVGL